MAWDNDEIIAEIIASAGVGRSALAAAMARPIREMLGLPSPDPCPACGRTDAEEGHRAGCAPCTAASVIES